MICPRFRFRGLSDPFPCGISVFPSARQSCPSLRDVGTTCLAGWGHWPLRLGAGQPSWLRPRLGRDPVLPPRTTHLAVDEDHGAQQPPRAPLAVDVQHPQDLEEADAPAEDRSLGAPPPCAPPLPRAPLPPPEAQGQGGGSTPGPEPNLYISQFLWPPDHLLGAAPGSPQFTDEQTAGPRLSGPSLSPRSESALLPDSAPALSLTAPRHTARRSHTPAPGSPQPRLPDGRGGKHLPFGAHAEDDHGGHDHDEVWRGQRHRHRPGSWTPARSLAVRRDRAQQWGHGDTSTGRPGPPSQARAQATRAYLPSPVSQAAEGSGSPGCVELDQTPCPVSSLLGQRTWALRLAPVWGTWEVTPLALGSCPVTGGGGTLPGGVRDGGPPARFWGRGLSSCQETSE